MNWIDTAGNIHYDYDMCPFCQMDTGGGHRLDCPNNPKLVILPIVVRNPKNIELKLNEREKS